MDKITLHKITMHKRTVKYDIYNHIYAIEWEVTDEVSYSNGEAYSRVTDYYVNLHFSEHISHDIEIVNRDEKKSNHSMSYDCWKEINKKITEAMDLYTYDRLEQEIMNL